MKDLKDFKDIREIREFIDKIDFQILELFANRNRYTEEIINFKTNRTGVIARERQRELLASRRKWAEDLNLNPDLFEKIFKLLIKSNIKKQLEILDKKNSMI